MEKVILPNGLTVIFEKRKGNSVVVNVMIKVGSNSEDNSEKGLSHFMEHILFEGTEKRPTNKDISNEIEKIGGDFNAYTSNEKTCFYVKVLKKHFPIAVEILADILQHSLLQEKDIAKEKKVVLKEIDMIYDEPRYFQWVLLQENLFEKHPCRYPTYGTKKSINSLTRKKIIDFYNKYYLPNNMVISVVGEVTGWKKEIEKKFSFKKGALPASAPVNEPLALRKKIKKRKMNITNTYLVLGFKAVPRNHPDSYTLDVINGILGRGQSGRMFTEIRSKRGLAYDVGTQSIAEKSFGYFAAYATIDKKNISLVQKLILTELDKLKKVTETDLSEAKDFIEGDYLLGLEDAQKASDQILFWDLVKEAKLMDQYIKNIKIVSVAEVKRVAQKYFKNYTMVVLAGK
ncbi:MAG: pitrilysin family protein [Nanoarchaeota archaeon]